MTRPLPEPVDPAEWRRRAEEQLESEEPEDPGGIPPLRVVHELRVHQLELEMQNETLREARLVAEAGWERFQELYDFAPAGYFSVDGQGAILEVNLAGARLLGADRAILANRRFARFLTRADRAVFATFLQRGLENQEHPPCEVSLPGGRTGGIRVRLQGASSADGKVLQMVALDITEQRAAQEQADLIIQDLQGQVERLTARLAAATTELGLARKAGP
jgi:PAS domain S-box-containing protein